MAALSFTLRLVVLLLGVFLVNAGNETFQCYSCKVGEYDCETNPSEDSLRDCSLPNYCFIQHQTYIENGKLFDLVRSCIAKNQEQGCYPDAHFKTCFTYCQTDKCNSDDGANPTKTPADGEPGAPRPLTGVVLLAAVMATVTGLWSGYQL